MLGNTFFFLKMNRVLHHNLFLLILATQLVIEYLKDKRIIMKPSAKLHHKTLKQRCSEGSLLHDLIDQWKGITDCNIKTHLSCCRRKWTHKMDDEVYSLSMWGNLEVIVRYIDDKANDIIDCTSALSCVVHGTITGCCSRNANRYFEVWARRIWRKKNGKNRRIKLLN